MIFSRELPLLFLFMSVFCICFGVWGVARAWPVCCWVKGGFTPDRSPVCRRTRLFHFWFFPHALGPWGGGCRFLGFPVPQRSGGTLRHGCEWMEGRERSHRSSILDLYSTGWSSHWTRRSAESLIGWHINVAQNALLPDRRAAPKAQIEPQTLSSQLYHWANSETSA